MCELAFVASIIIIPWYCILYDLPPQFSIGLTPISRGQDVSAPASAFQIMLQASNRRATERCYRHGEGVVTYAGFAIASGRVPGFCVPGKGHREVHFLVLENGVDLPKHLRDRMTAAHKVGALELEVQVMLFQGGDASSGRPTRMWCKATTGGVQPPEVTMCTVLALQNWFHLDD